MMRLAQNRKYKLILFSNASLLSNVQIPAMMQCDTVKLSLHGQGEEDNIKRWLNVKRHPRTYLMHVITEANAKDTPSVVQYWQPKLSRRDGLMTKSIISYGGVMKDDYMKPNPCKVLRKPRLMVAWNGDCTPCNLDVNVDMCVWNIERDGNLEEMVKSYRYQGWMENIKEKNGICANCFDANNHRETKIYHGTKT
jgi:radical SAM protein with 4Fe4S-binding SPASM domain